MSPRDRAEGWLRTRVVLVSLVPPEAPGSTGPVAVGALGLLGEGVRLPPVGCLGPRPRCPLAPGHLCTHTFGN
eukprot:10485687-Alexandrium_andersonii.AAC.1